MFSDNVDCVCHYKTEWTQRATASQVSRRLRGFWGSQPHRGELSLLDSVGQQCFPNVVLLVADVSSHPPPKTSQGYLRSALWLEPQFERPREVLVVATTVEERFQGGCDRHQQ